MGVVDVRGVWTLAVVPGAALGQFQLGMPLAGAAAVFEGMKSDVGLVTLQTVVQVRGVV